MLPGSHWCNNGVIQKVYRDKIPEGYVKGRIITPEHRAAIGKSHSIQLQRRKILGIHPAKRATSWNAGLKTGKHSPNRKATLDTETGIVYETVTECYKTLHLTTTKFYKLKKKGRFVTTNVLLHEKLSK